MAFSKEKAHERAEKFAAKGQHDRAAREYQTIVEADPKDIRAWLMLADCLVRCGDRAGAVDRYLQVAGYYAAQKQSQKALAVYRQVVNLDPRRIDVHQKIAQLNLELGRVQDAVAIYEQLGHAQLQAGNTADALVTFELIANAEPTAVSKRLRVAELYSRERQPEKAVEHFRMAGDQLLANGRRSDYVRVAERLIYHKPDDTPTIRGLARAYLELKDPRRALMKLNALLHADPHDRDGLELLAETFLALEKPDKATSVAIELVRQLQNTGESGVIEAARVARRALAWDPHNAELLSAARAAADIPPRSPTMPPGSSAMPQASSQGAGADGPQLERRRPQPQVQATQPQSAPPPSRVRTQPQQQLDAALDEPDDDDDVVEADDVLELDEADVMSDSSQIRIAEPAPATARYGHQELRAAGAAQSMTNRVLSEVETSAATVDSVDFDKILFEARVYIKYRLFEHAIEHIGELLAAQPEHVGALALRARALGELGRGHEAAETHIRVARLVADRDPKLAREHVTAAIDCDPTNMVAQALRADLDGTPVHGTPLEDGLADHGDSGTFDVVGDDVSGPVSSPSGDDHEFEIEVSEQQEEVVQTRPITVENRFGLSDARPLPGPDDVEHEHEHAHTEDLGPDLQSALVRHGEERREGTDRTPLFGYRARPPGQDDRPTESLGQPDGTTGRFTPMREPGAPEPLEGARPGRVLVEPDAEEPPFDVAAIAVQLEDEESLPPPEPVRPAVAKTMKPMPTAPATPMPASGGWPDLGDELAEVRFFLDQGLEDDARASLAELDRRHKGHPEVAALLRELDRETAQPQQHSGATPLVDLSAEDEEEDAYLSAIFGGEPEKKKKDKNVEIRATTTGVDPGDPSTAYDLGMAYREMGLVDDALAQFEQAARDPGWEARALVMSGTLRVHRGETDRALADLRRAIESATNEDELYEAKYELAVIYETLGNTDGAIEELYGVPAGYRERDEKLAALES